LEDAERYEGQTEDDEEGDDAAVRPGVGHVPPFESEQEADDGRDKDDGADGIEAPEGGPPRLLLPRVRFQSEEEQNPDGRHAAQRQIDVEAPAPGDQIGERSAQLERERDASAGRSDGR
jgi:hypothetical protein